MRIACISDTHCQLEYIPIPEADILIHAGDATDLGKLQELIQFNAALGKVKARFKHILFVPGNHDLLFETDPNFARQIVSNATILIDQPITIENRLFYGSPWTPEFRHWAFGGNKNKLEEMFSHIPEETDILITHGPPGGILDSSSFHGGLPLGSYELLSAIERIKPKLHVFGHIHGGYGTQQIGTTQFVNAAACTERLSPIQSPFVIEV